MKKLILIGILFLSTHARAALDYGIELGGRQQSGDVYGAGFSSNAKWGMQAGGFAHMPLEGGVAHFRTGLFYTQRPLEAENDITGNKTEFNLDYIEIPLEILFKPNEKVGLYLGFTSAINISKSCSGDSSCKVSDVDTPYFPMVFGGMVKFNPKFGLDLYFEGANGSVAKGLGNYKAFGINLMYSLD
jgi:hypothetical protein